MFELQQPALHTIIQNKRNQIPPNSQKHQVPSPRSPASTHTDLIQPILRRPLLSNKPTILLHLIQYFRDHSSAT
jgi:hypothetical protein